MIKIEYRKNLIPNSSAELTFHNFAESKKLTLLDGINLVEEDIYNLFSETDYFKSLLENKILIIEISEPILPNFTPDKSKSKIPPPKDD